MGDLPARTVPLLAERLADERICDRCIRVTAGEVLERFAVRHCQHGIEHRKPAARYDGCKIARIEMGVEAEETALVIADMR